MLWSGVFERYPNLKICLSHGGGFVPYQAGRFVHGWHVRTEPKKKLPKPPSDSINRFLFDTITHSSEVLQFLVGNAGANRVLLGSDYPFDMGMPDGVLQVKNLSARFPVRGGPLRLTVVMSLSSLTFTLAVEVVVSAS